MANTDDKPALKITLDDLAKVQVRTEAAAAAVAAAGARTYGNIAAAGTDAPAALTEEKGHFFLQGWFYLGLAGLLGPLIAWGICEHSFQDPPLPHSWGNYVLMPLVLTLMCVGFGIAESVVERSMRKALWNGMLSVVLGLVFGFIFDFVANIIYALTYTVVVQSGIHTIKNPAFWIARGIAWAVFGVAGGIVYGIVDRSGRKMKYGVLGGLIGAGLGGTVFDPIGMATNAGGPSRAVGFGLLGLATGVAIGIVESALKDRWLYVAAGPLAGKQFILYKPITMIGSNQKSDIYLFKDNSILPEHGRIELRGAQTFLYSAGPIFVSGQPVRMRALQSGDLIQIGRYAFHFRERHRN